MSFVECERASGHGKLIVACTQLSRRTRLRVLAANRATVADGCRRRVEMGYSSVIFVDLGVKVDGAYYYDLLLSQQLLPAILHVAIVTQNSYVFRH